MKQEIVRDFGERIKAIRSGLKLNQKEFASKLEVSSSYISEIENGKIGPGFDFLYKLSLQYNINPFYLFHGNGPAFLGDESQWLSTQTPAKCLQEEPIKQLIQLIEKSKTFKYSVLAFFMEFQIDNSELLKKEHSLKKKDKVD